MCVRRTRKELIGIQLKKFGPDCLSMPRNAIVLVTLAQLSTCIRNHADGSDH